MWNWRCFTTQITKNSNQYKRPRVPISLEYCHSSNSESIWKCVNNLAICCWVWNWTKPRKLASWWNINYYSRCYETELFCFESLFYLSVRKQAWQVIKCNLSRCWTLSQQNLDVSICSFYKILAHSGVNHQIKIMPVAMLSDFTQ